MLAPVIDDIDLIFERDPRRFQIGNGHGDTPWRHISCRVMLSVQEQHPWMRPASGQDQVVRIKKILIILRQEDRGLADGIRQMLGVGDPGAPDRRREQYCMSQTMQLGHHAPISAVVIQGEPHT